MDNISFYLIGIRSVFNRLVYNDETIAQICAYICEKELVEYD